MGDAEQPQIERASISPSSEGGAEGGAAVQRPVLPKPELPKMIPFRELCRCGDEVWIEHQGQLYRLRCTKQGKLLLTK